jgi:predicted O-methyltransferase YrrM
MKNRTISEYFGENKIYEIIIRLYKKYVDVPLRFLPVVIRMLVAGDKKILKISGMDPLDLMCLYRWAGNVKKNGIAVEIGSYLGSSAATIASALRSNNGHLYCVDTWENSAMSEGTRDTFAIFNQNTEFVKNNITALRGYSSDIANSFDRDIDFLFIDGDHSYNGSHQDVLSWFPKLRKGGILVFHDYPRAPGVVKTVEELLESNSVSLGLRIENFFYCKKD